MRCSDPRCTGSHNDRHYDTLCPRSRENKNASGRESYYRNIEREREKQRAYRNSAAGMLAQVKYEARRRGHR